jgi:hypothetical protein
MSPTAASLLRALIARSGVSRDRILLIDVQSTDWRSLTFAGERHLSHLRVPGPGSRDIVDRLCCGLDDVEFNIAAIVADVTAAEAEEDADGSFSLTIEALTVAAD